jgi:uncharacterized protein
VFLLFFQTLKNRGIPVSLQELFDLYRVLEELTKSGEALTPKRFFTIARLTLVKDLKYYDDFELAFALCFEGQLNDQDFKARLEDWLKNALERELSQQQKDNALKLPPEELLRELEKRLQTQKEQHHGGNHWIGTGGTSAFGHSGFNPQGVRIGGQGKNRSALAVIGERRYREYRSDEALSTRNIKLALKGLRQLKRQGPLEFDLKKTIEVTCKNAGEIELMTTHGRKNSLKVLLLLDVGGSMTPYARRVEQLFSAFHQLHHFKEFKSLYFHNIFYDHLYSGAALTLDRSVLITDIMRRYDRETRVFILGDAAMAPFEFFQMSGLLRHAYDYYGRHHGYPLTQEQSRTGQESLQKWLDHFPHTVWLNPDPKDSWAYTSTTAAIHEMTPMFPLTLHGLKKATQQLIGSANERR